MALRIAIAWILGLALAVNGLAMLAKPLAWYGNVPGAPETGPFNPHFVRDIGCAYLMAGAALAGFAARPSWRPAAQAAAGFLTLHALVHLADFVAGREHVHALPADLVSIYLVAALTLWIVFRPHPVHGGESL